MARRVAGRWRLLRVVAAGLALVVSAPLWLRAIGGWLAYPPTMRSAEAIVVFGGARERTKYGIALYQQGLAPELWHTGYARHEDSVVGFIRRRTLPQGAIYYLPSTSTWEDAREVVAFARARSVSRLLVVTSWYHSRRTMCALRTQLAGSGIDVTFSAPPNDEDGPDGWWRSAESRRQVASELVKIGYYWVRFGVTPWGC